MIDVAGQLPAPDLSTISVEELTSLCAIDSELFEKQFFAKTCRQKGSIHHPKLWKLLGSGARYINIQMHRDGAKTTKCRIYAAKRVAYGLSRTILIIGKSEAHALRTGKWLRKQIEHNKRYSEFFKLKPGAKWQDGEMEIIHEGMTDPATGEQVRIHILCVGIHGSIRGINFEDYRPDLILFDDVIDPENAATKEQRDKIEDLMLSDVKNSLAPASECPDAQLIILQTPLNREDASCKALNDPEFVSAVFSCWTDETKDLPVHLQESSWPDRYSSEVLRAEKRSAIARNKLSLFLREKECRLANPETNAFLEEWLKYYEIEPSGGVIANAIDPVPPPSDREIAMGFKYKDFEVHVSMKRANGNFYLLEYEMKHGHEPDWTLATFFTMGFRRRPRTIVVETTAYQKTLEWIIKKAMAARRAYYVVKGFKDSRSKYDRIVDSIQPIASNGKFYVKREHHEAIAQFLNYPNVSHDDVLDAISICIMELSGQLYAYTDGDDVEDVDDGEEEYKRLLAEEKAMPALKYGSVAP